MTADEALKIARAAAQANRLRFSRHAIERMQERVATRADVQHAVSTADVAFVSPDGSNRWVLCGGGDLDECELRAVVAIDDEGEVTVTVVTVHPHMSIRTGSREPWPTYPQITAFKARPR